jgi:HAD superfamily hydrolase (TIGR01509 family)
MCDADGCLFPSEDPAYEASIAVTNALLAELGVSARYTAGEVRAQFTGHNFRTSSERLAERHNATLRPQVLDRWVAAERGVVTQHLAKELRPDPGVLGPLAALARQYTLAVVSSSARVRVDACLEATAGSPYFDRACRFSAEDSLPVPTSKPDPAIYAHAAAVLGVAGKEALAIEDSPVGVRSAVAAGIPVVGLLEFVPPGERAHREADLRSAGATAVLESWSELATALAPVHS